jgi:hypothetical protein
VVVVAGQLRAVDVAAGVSELAATVDVQTGMGGTQLLQHRG